MVAVLGCKAAFMLHACGVLARRRERGASNVLTTPPTPCMLGGHDCDSISVKICGTSALLHTESWAWRRTGACEHFVLMGVEENRRLRPGRGPATVFPMGHVDPAEARGVPQQELAARTFRRATGDAFRLAATMGRFGESAKDWAFHFETGKALVFFKACEGPKAPERRRAWKKKGSSGKALRVRAR